MTKIHKCTVENCNATFARPSKLNVHMRKHTGERPFPCIEPGCDKTYTNLSHLRRHKNVSHSEKNQEDTLVMCDFKGCGLVLANKYSLKKHMKKHTPEHYPFVCSECKQGFHRKKQLQKHSYLHTGEPPFKCDQCPMGFTLNAYLNRHKKTHKIHKCHCGYEFNTWSLYTGHRKKCKQKTFKCKTCDKTFQHLKYLRNHLIIHEPEDEKTVYVCPHSPCRRFYFYKSNLAYHIKTVHQKLARRKNFKCSYPKCLRDFSTSQKLRVHLSTHFKWRRKDKSRKTRRDKGKIKPIINRVTGRIDILLDDPKKIHILSDIRLTDEMLLDECDKTIQKLKEQL